MPPTRQLAAIMFTDIEGYTAAMQANEEKALMMKDRHRQILEDEHKNFNGNIVQYYGDGTLSIFGSAVQAVKCALIMQQFFCKEPQVPVRIGLHVGDIMVNNGDIFGDGVNLASRIESLGISGSVLISEKVNDEIRNHPGIKTVSMGSYHFKNVQREIEVFALEHDGIKTPLPNSLKGKTQEKKKAEPTNVVKKSIAVLPFVNMSNDPEQEYFSDGIAEEILNALAHLQNLDVAGRTSSFQFKGKNIDVRQIGKKLGVSNVLEGSVRKHNNRVRVTAQLVNVEDGFHIWSERYDRDIDDIFAIQDDVSLCITEKLKITLLEKERANIIKAPTENQAAYDLYLKGRFYWNRRGKELKKGLEFFAKAVEIDPNFSLAYAGIADTYALFAFYSILPQHDVVPKARKAAERAIQLNPSRIEPYSVLAYLTMLYDWDWEESKKQFEKAISISASYAPTHYWYSNYMCFVQRDYTHAAEQALIAIELDPLVSHSYTTLSSVYFCAGRFEDALKASRTAIEMDANSFLSHCSLSMALHALGRYDEAIESTKFAVTFSARHQYTLLQLSWLYAETGNIQGAQQILDELMLRSKTEFISSLSVAVAAYHSKNYDIAIEFLEKAFDERASLLIIIYGFPFLAFIKTDPRYALFMERINFPK